MKKLLLFLVFITASTMAFCQDPGSVIRDRTRGIGQNSGNTNTRRSSSDTTKKKGNNKLDTLGFERRDDLADSITISFRYMDSVRKNPLDSTINDFDKYYSVPSTYQYLGNNGAAAFPCIFYFPRLHFPFSFRTYAGLLQRTFHMIRPSGLFPGTLGFTSISCYYFLLIENK